MEIKKEKIPDKENEYVLSFPIGYAVFKNDTLFIPAIAGNMRKILQLLYEETKCKKMVFTAILDPIGFGKRLHNIKREWSEFVDYYGDWVNCIEIEYIPKEKTNDKNKIRR